MKILIVDDQPANRALLNKLLAKTACQILLAENGQEAIDIFQQQQPDLILMDMMMPVMDGTEAIKIIRSLNTEKRVQIIIISALGDENNTIKGLSVGADDYISKPFNGRIVEAKVSAIQRMLTMQKTLLENKHNLQTYQHKNERELNFAKSVFEKIIAQNSLNDKQLNYWIEPSKMFSGDLISVKRIAENQLYFMLADATGHGLSAALPTIIVNQVFQAMSQKKASISSIAREINNRLNQDIPLGHFVALAIGLIDNTNKTMEIWNGGLPPLFALNSNNEVVQQFPSTHVSCGIFSDKEFDDSTEHWHWTEKSELFLYSDGLTDVLDEQSKSFGEQQLMNVLLQSTEGNRIQAIKEAVNQHIDPDNEQDDISCLVIYCE